VSRPDPRGWGTATSGPPAGPTTDPTRFRHLLGHFASGVTVVTYPGQDGVRGITVNAFASVSLRPPLVLVSVDRASRAARALGGVPFTVNILAAEQRDLAVHFSGGRRLAEIAWRGEGDDRRLAGCLAYLDCEPWTCHDGGDHLLHLGLVTATLLGTGTPLLFYRGAFTSFPHEIASMEDP
jgi:flavin reductase (DIM6/NTAB) family NADH-FMN oxidoreductase RutF